MDKYITINEDRYKNFFDNYESENGIICNQKSKTYYENGESYLCRFCGKNKPEVKFSKDAHIIPQLLGNRYLLSKFECDNCNSQFGKYEEALSSYLGFFRTFVQLKNRNSKGLPKFKDKNSGFEMYYENEKVQIHLDKSDINSVLDEKNNTAKLVANKFSYIPINVYKCLLKISLCLVDVGELMKYEQSLLFLQSDKFNKKLNNFPLYRMFIYFVPGDFSPNPAAFLFKRKSNISEKSIPTHTMLLFFRNHMYQIFLPFYKDDLIMHRKTTNYDLFIAPLILNKNKLPEGTNYTWNNIDLSSSDKRIKEPYEVNLKFLTLEINNTA